MIQQFYNKLLQIVRRAYISLSNNDTADYSSVQISYHGKTNNMQVIYPYGINANAPENTLALVFKIGTEENLIGMPYACKERFKNLKRGEVVVGSPKSGSYIKFDENGGIEIFANGNVLINSSKLGMFNISPVVQQTGGVATAGGSYTSNEQDMINKIYTALRNYGLLS